MTIYVVRHTAKDDMGSSSPCSDCHRKILELGIKRIIYSESDGTLTSSRPCDYKPYGETLGRRYIENDFKFSHKHGYKCCCITQ